MILWLILALMTGAALAAVLWPLLRRGGTLRSGSDVAVYRDQLEGIERDQTLGLIPASEAEAARVEISRRLIAAADRAEDTAAPSGASLMRGHRAIALAILLLLPLGAGACYLWLGSPDISAAPIASRQEQIAAQRAIDNMVAQVETYLQRNPEDGRGWEVLAPVYMRMGRFDESARAWQNVIRLLGETAERQANLGEALMSSGDGTVTPEAKIAFDRAFALDPTLVSARYYLGLAAEQDGRRDEAANIWRALIAEAPAGAHWTGQVREALARAEGKAPGAPPAAAPHPAPATPESGTAANASAPRGPTAGDLAAADAMAPDQRNAMVQSMVDGLAARLKKDGSDLDGWMRLVRSYAVLGEPDKARAAVADARRALAADADKLRQLDEFVKGLGLQG